MPILDRLAQVAYIDRVKHPRYSTADALVSVDAIKRLKTDHIKMVFPDVSDTNEWAGSWYVSRKRILRCKKFNNNGLWCYIVPLKWLEPLVVGQKSMYDLW